MIAQRVEKHIIKKNSPHYSMLLDFCHRSKNLYNHANYIIREELTKNGKWIRYNDLDKILKADKEYPDYADMPTAASAQQTLRVLDKDWKGYFKSHKDWKKHPEKYLGEPKFPKFKKKNGYFSVYHTGQQCKIKNGIVRFPKSFNGFTLSSKIDARDDFISLQQVRIKPCGFCLKAEIVYRIDVPEQLSDNSKHMGIDIGVDNLATVVNNLGKKPFVINGKGLKSINQYYNKQIARYRKIAKQMNDRHNTKRMDRITDRRNRKVDDYMQKASRIIVNYAKSNDISVIVIGHNDEWKQKSDMGKIVNQNFTQLLFNRLIEMIEYKSEEYGIAVVRTEESYTSGTGVIDGEAPIKQNYNKSRRVFRGLFKTESGVKINADVNGAYQILKKVFPNEFSDGIVGVALHPVIVNAA